MDKSSTKRSELRFKHSLNQILFSRPRDSLQVVEFRGRQTIKHLVESLGVPHTEVGDLMLDGKHLDFSYIVADGDRILVFPAAADLDRLSGMCKNNELSIPARFILDNHLGKLTSSLRMLGFDADYRNNYQDDDLEQEAVRQERILLTRDRQLLMRKSIQYGYLIRSLKPDEQIVECLERFNLYSEIALFKRCMRCNQILKPVKKEEIEDRLEPLTRKYFFKFHICPGCHQIYWPGSHVERMQSSLAGILPEQ